MSKYETTLKRTSIDIGAHSGRQRQTKRKTKIQQPNEPTSIAHKACLKLQEENNNDQEKKTSGENVFDFCLCFDFGYIFSRDFIAFFAYLLRNSICFFVLFYFSTTNRSVHTHTNTLILPLVPLRLEARLFSLSHSAFFSSALLTVMYVYISLENVNFMLLFKLNILPYVCFSFYCHALSHLSLIETVMFTL